MKIYNIHSYKDFLCHVVNKPNNLLILFVYKDDYIKDKNIIDNFNNLSNKYSNLGIYFSEFNIDSDTDKSLELIEKLDITFYPLIRIYKCTELIYEISVLTNDSISNLDEYLELMYNTKIK